MEPSVLAGWLLVVLSLEVSPKLSVVMKPMSLWDNLCPRVDSSSDVQVCQANISWESSSAKDIATGEPLCAADIDSCKTCVEAPMSPPHGMCPVPGLSSRSSCSLVRDDFDNTTAYLGPFGSFDTRCEWDEWNKGMCHAGPQKHGVCPPVVHDVLCLQFVEYCFADSECPDLLKCCDAKCERRCVPPLKGEYKLGSCPLVIDKVVCTQLEEGCKSDLGCPGELKCCRVPCGQACVQPRSDSIKHYIPFK